MLETCQFLGSGHHDGHYLLTLTNFWSFYGPYTPLEQASSDPPTNLPKLFCFALALPTLHNE